MNLILVIVALLSSQIGLGYYAIHRLTMGLKTESKDITAWMHSVDMRLFKIETKLTERRSQNNLTVQSEAQL